MPTNNWDETAPADSDVIADGAGEIRTFKQDVVERWGYPLSDYANLTAAIAAVDVNKAVLLIDKDITTDATAIIPATCQVKFLGGYQVTVALGHTLTINSTNIECPDVQAFVVTGTLVLAAGSVLRSTWFTTIAVCEAAFAGEGLMVIPNVEDDTDAAITNTAILVFDQRHTEGPVAGNNRVVVARAAGTIPPAYVDADDFDGDGLIVTSNQLVVNADDSSLEIAANVLQVKALGVTTPMLAITDYTAAAAGYGVGSLSGTAKTLSIRAYEKIAEGTIPAGGTLYSLMMGKAYSSVFAPHYHRLRIYKNGVALGTEHVISVDDEPGEVFTDTITVARGDLIQVYAMADDHGSDSTRLASWVLRSSTGENRSFSILGLIA